MTDFRQKIDQLRDTLVGVVPQPEGQIAQITYALIYKFMNDFDAEAVAMGGKRAYFAGDYEKFAWHNLMRPQLDARAREALYAEALDKMSVNPNIPPLFRDIFLDARLPYKNPLTCDLFLKQIDVGFSHNGDTHTDDIGDAYEYLLQATGAQGGVGQFRTPRHIIQFIVECVAPTATDTILDPAVGTAGFLIAAYKYILSNHETHETSRKNENDKCDSLRESRSDFVVKKSPVLSVEQRARLHTNFRGFDIDPTMVRTAQVNLYLHGFKTPRILPHDTLTSEDYWDERYDIILANPPFMTPKGGIQPHKKFSVAAKRSEVLFTDYIATHLKPKGRAGFIVPEGIIFQSGKAYRELRKNLVEQHGLFAVISLPGGVFQPYSGVKTSILLLDPVHAKTTDDILFIKIENDGYTLGSQRRPIEANDLPGALEIVRAFQQGEIATTKHTKHHEKEAHTEESFRKSRSDFVPFVVQTNPAINYQLVPKTAVAATPDYNLSGDRYIKTETIASKFPMVALGEVCELVRGVTYSKSDEVASGGHQILRANNISLDSVLNLTDIKQISANIKLPDDKKLYKDDIFICLASGSKAHIGKVVHIKQDTDFYFGGFMGSIRVNSKKVDPEFIFWTLRDKKFNEYLDTAIAGVNINNLNARILYAFQIPLPPLEIQRDIVARIATKQHAIAAAREVIAALEAERQHFDPRPRAQCENWPTVKLGDVGKIRMCKRIFKEQTTDNGDIPFYKIGTFGKEPDAFISKKVYDGFIAKYPHPSKGQILISTSGTIGRTVVFDGKPAYFQDSNIVWIENDETLVLNSYLNLVYQSIQWVTAKGGTIERLYNKLIEETELPLPPLAIQREYIAEFEQESTIIAANRTLITLMEKKIAATLADLWEGDK